MCLFSFYLGNNQPCIILISEIFLLMNSNIHKSPRLRLVLLFANNWSSDLIYGCFRSLAKNFPIKNCTWDIHNNYVIRYWYIIETVPCFLVTIFFFRSVSHPLHTLRPMSKMEFVEVYIKDKLEVKSVLFAVPILTPDS
jgi:hypothetical protein